MTDPWSWTLPNLSPELDAYKCPLCGNFRKPGQQISIEPDVLKEFMWSDDPYKER